MPDVLADGRFGRDDGIKCHECGGPTFLSYDDGDGLIYYNCENEACEATTGVQYERDFEDPDSNYDPDADYYLPD